MKAIFKLIPVALGLLTVASCSNDELFGEKVTTPKGKTLQVSVETPVDALTRAANTADGNNLVWQEGDEITVYDANLFKYDPYDYSKESKAFVLKEGESAYLESPAYALFPNRFFNSANTHWDRETNKVYAIAEINPNLGYGDDHNGEPVAAESSAYLDNDGDAAYVSNMPMWGTAAKDGETTKASLKYTTAILKVKLNNAMGNVNYLYVRGFSDLNRDKPAQLSGEFKLTMSDTDGNALTSSKLESNEEATNANNYLEIDISNIDKATSVIYVPVPAGHYGKLDIWAKNKKVENPGLKGTAIADADLIQTYTDKTFDVKFYATGNTKTYNVDATAPSKITALLNAAKDETANVKIDGSANATTATATDDDEITVPDMKASQVELKLHSFIGAAVEINGASFKNTLILNLTNENGQPITIDLPNANIVLLGNYNSKAVTINNAKAVSFGDGTTTTTCAGTVTIRSEVYGPLTVAAKATTDALTLLPDHRIAEVTIDGTCGNLFVKEAAQNDCKITVNGTAKNIENDDAGAITLSGVATSIANKTGDITINGAPNYAATSYAKVAVVVTKGDVTVALDNEGAAIGTSLTLVDGKKLTLTQGYVKSVVGPTGVKEKATVELGTEAKYIALATTENNVEVTGTTKWNGEMIGGSIDTEAKAEAIKEGLKSTREDVIKAWQAYKDAATAVYTAIGLAENASTFTLANDIDLNNKAWTPVATTDEIKGGGKTIKNVTVAVPADGLSEEDATKAETAGLGLFSELKHAVSNLTLDGVTVNAAVITDKAATPGKHTISNIGALAGKTNAAVELTAVTVKNINLLSAGQDKTANGAKAIGGVIGLAGAKVTMTGVVVEGGSIKGYCEMGGLIGNAGANAIIIQKKAKAEAPVTAADVKSAVSGVTFTANHNSASTTPAVDVNYLKVGNFIGASTPNTAQIEISDADNIEASKLSYNKEAYSGYTSDIEGVNFYDYVFGQGLVGLVGDAGKTQYTTNYTKINGKYYQVYLTKAAATAASLDGSVESKAIALHYINK